MTTLDAISVTAAAGIFGIFTMLVLCLRHGKREFARGWEESREQDHWPAHPARPAYAGRHELTADEAETAIAQFLADSEPMTLPPLPKRKSAATTQNRQEVP